MSKLIISKFFRLVVVVVVVVLLASSAAHAKDVARISNVLPRRDRKTGHTLPISDGSLLQHGDFFYLYGVSYQRCARSQQPVCYKSCGWLNASFAVARSRSLESHDWDLLSDNILPIMTDKKSPYFNNATAYFSPFVVFNEKTNKFVMWFMFEFSRKAVATSSSPEGPFEIVRLPNATGIPSELAVGSSVYLWVDDDENDNNENNEDQENFIGGGGGGGSGVEKSQKKKQTAHMLFNIIVRWNATTPSLYVARLTSDFLAVEKFVPVPWNCQPPSHSCPIGANSKCFKEGGGLFRHKTTTKLSTTKTNSGKNQQQQQQQNLFTWYLVAGTGCCFCKPGASSEVWRSVARSSSDPLTATFEYRGFLNPRLNAGVGCNSTYAIDSQQFGVHRIKSKATGEITPLYIGMRWGSGVNKRVDFQYWGKIGIDEKSNELKKMRWENEFELNI